MKIFKVLGSRIIGNSPKMSLYYSQKYGNIEKVQLHHKVYRNTKTRKILYVRYRTDWNINSRRTNETWADTQAKCKYKYQNIKWWKYNPTVVFRYNSKFQTIDGFTRLHKENMDWFCEMDTYLCKYHINSCHTLLSMFDILKNNDDNLRPAKLKKRANVLLFFYIIH